MIVLLVVFVLLPLIRTVAANCPPKDFPIYPKAQQTGFNYNFSGATTDCTLSWEADGAPSQVMTFYDASLGSGPWQLVNKDAQSGDWSFQKRGDSSTVGRIRFLGHGTQTRIEMDVLTGQSPVPSPTG